MQSAMRAVWPRYVSRWEGRTSWMYLDTKQLVTFGVGRMICWFNFFGAIPHERVLGSMELFSAEVLPHVQEGI